MGFLVKDFHRKHFGPGASWDVRKFKLTRIALVLFFYARINCSGTSPPHQLDYIQVVVNIHMVHKPNPMNKIARGLELEPEIFW